MLARPAQYLKYKNPRASPDRGNYRVQRKCKECGGAVSIRAAWPYESRSETSWDSFDLENWRRHEIASLELGAGQSVHYCRRVGYSHLGLHSLLLRLLLKLHVEEPFVYLDTGEACLAHGLLADLAVPFASQLFK